MAERVYHRFAPGDVFQTKIRTHPHYVWMSGTYGYSGSADGPSGSVSLYSGVRRRDDVFSGSASGLEVYPIDFVDTHSIDKVIGVPGLYPSTSSIRFARCTDEEKQFSNDLTDVRWYDEHYRPIELLFGYYADNTRYRVTQNGQAVGFKLNTGSFDDTLGWDVFHVPSIFYGRGIKSGSILVVDWTADPGVAHVYRDDGLGSLFEMSVTWDGSSSLPSYSDEDFQSIQAASVFYDQGLIVVRGTYFNVLGRGPESHPDGTHVRLEFDGDNTVVSKVAMCRIGMSQANASNNPTYYYTDTDGNAYSKSSSSDGPVTYVTALGIYNEHKELVAVAKVAQPIRKREQDQIDVRLRLDI